MAAQFRLQVNTEAYLRFQVLAAFWSAIPAHEQHNVCAGAKAMAQPGCQYGGELPRVARYADPAATDKSVDRLRFVARYWGKLTTAAQVTISEHARSVAQCPPEFVALASIAKTIESLSITPRGRKTRVLPREAARQWATEHAQLLGVVRPEYGGWCANFVDGLGAVIATCPVAAEVGK